MGRTHRRRGRGKLHEVGLASGLAGFESAWRRYTQSQLRQTF